jgi:hypothetical protein
MPPYRDKKVVGVFVPAFFVPLHCAVEQLPAHYTTYARTVSVRCSDTERYWILIGSTVLLVSCAPRSTWRAVCYNHESADLGTNLQV